MKTEERTIAIEDRLSAAGELLAIPFERTVSPAQRRLIPASSILSAIIKALFLAAWGYGLFQGGFLGLFCIFCGIVVLAVTTFTR